MNHFRTVYRAIIILSLLAVLPVVSAEPELHIGKFSSGDLTGWKEQTVFGSKKSTYSFIQENGKTVLLGKSNNAASGLMYKIDIDPKVYPVIKWSWKIDHTVKKANERTKDGHDFAARLYVVFPRGFFARHRAIEYVWGNVLRKGESCLNPYSKNVIMIAVDGGDELAGHWVTHSRNFAEDYRASFGEEPPKAGAIAIMTDSDNTHESSTGYFGDITVLPATREDDIKTKDSVSASETPQKTAVKTHHKELATGNAPHSPSAALPPPAQSMRPDPQHQ